MAQNMKDNGMLPPSKEVISIDVSEPSEFGKILLFSIASYTPIWFVLYWIGKINFFQIGLVVYMVSFNWLWLTVLLFIQSVLLHVIQKKMHLNSKKVFSVHMGLLFFYCTILCIVLGVITPIDWQSADALLGFVLLVLYYFLLTAGVSALGYYFGLKNKKTCWIKK